MTLSIFTEMNLNEKIRENMPKINSSLLKLIKINAFVHTEIFL